MIRTSRQTPGGALLAIGLILSACSLAACPLLQAETNDQRPLEAADASPLASQHEDAENKEPPHLPPPPGAHAMPKPNRVWVDKKRGTVMVDGYISLRKGMLEMLACPQGTKEHESVVAVYSQAQVVHAALLAIGAETGQPVQWHPKFSPPTGTEIVIEAQWLDTAGKWQKIAAREWVQDVDTDKPMQTNWVFAGSSFWQDKETGEQIYQAEAGDFICVSNFSTATLDIPTESSQVYDGLLFAANTKKIPPLGTPVRLVLKPKLKKAQAAK